MEVRGRFVAQGADNGAVSSARRRLLPAAALLVAALVAWVWPDGGERRAQRAAARAVGPRAPLHLSDRAVVREHAGKTGATEPEAAATEPEAGATEPGAGAEEPEPRETLDDLVRDLADDDARGNATRAIPKLVALGVSAAGALERALDSADHQQRQLAAAVLRRIEGLPPSRRLLEITVEGLRHDGIPKGVQPYVFNAAEGVDYLARHVDAAADVLARALDSDDAQQRFAAAYVIARTGRTWALDRTCGLLIAHLEDNDVPNDASLACQALFGLGAPALPYLRRVETSPDPQQRRLAMRLVDDIVAPRSADADRPAAPGVIYAPGERRRLVHVPGVVSRHRWTLLRRVRSGIVPVPSLRALRREHGDALEFRAAHATSWSVLEVGTETRWRLLVLRVHDDGRVERRDDTDDGRRWVAVR